MWASVLSGIFSGVIGALLGIYTSGKADKRQEDLLKVQATNELIYHSQIEWYGKLRTSIAELITQFVHINVIIKKLSQFENEAQRIRLNGDNRQEMRSVLDDLDNMEKEINEALEKAQTQLILVNLYLFEDNEEERKVRNELAGLLADYYNTKPFRPIPEVKLDLLVEHVRTLLKNQQEQISKKIAN